MDTFNHGSCMPILAAVGGNMHLGDLEAECRGAPTTDGGGDASAIDCSAASGMPIAMACSQETAADAAFCQSACFTALQPYYEECSALMPAYMTMMLAPVVGLMASCSGPAGSATGVCDMVGLMATCSAPDAGLDELDGNDMTTMCANACITSMFPCTSNPMLAMTMGPELVAALPQLEAMCDTGGPGASGPGDGVCEMQPLIAMMADGTMDQCGDAATPDCT